MSIRSSPRPSRPTSYSFFLSLKRKPQKDKKIKTDKKGKKISKQNNSHYIQTHKHACFLPFHLCSYVCMYIYVCEYMYIHTYMLHMLINVCKHAY